MLFTQIVLLCAAFARVKLVSTSTPATTDAYITTVETPTTATDTTLTTVVPPTTATDTTLTTVVPPTTATDTTLTTVVPPTTATDTNITTVVPPTTATAANITTVVPPTTATATNITTAVSPTTATDTNITTVVPPTTATATNITTAVPPTTATATNITTVVPPTTATATNITTDVSPTTATATNITTVVPPTTATATNITTAVTSNPTVASTSTLKPAVVCSSLLVVGWSTSSVYRVNLTTNSVTALTTAGSGRAVAVDNVNKTMFWSENGGRLYRASTGNVAGTRKQMLANNWFGLGVDTTYQILFLSLGNVGVVMASYNVVEKSRVPVSGYSYSYGLVVDQNNGTVYWTDYIMNRLQSIQYTSTTFTGSVTTILQNTGSQPTGLALDTVGGTLYWMLLAGQLRSYNFNSATVTLTVTTPTSPSFGLAYCGDELFIADRNRYRIMKWGITSQTLTQMYLPSIPKLVYPIALAVES